jgi:hypothetical protein
MYSPVLNAGLGWLAIFNMIFGILGSNEKWKLYLFFFILGDAITKNYSEHSDAYIVTSSLFVALQAYRSLFFFTPSDNVYMFMGFFTAGFTVLIQAILKQYDVNIQIGYFIAPFILFTAKVII